MSAMSDDENDIVDEFLKQKLKSCRVSPKGLIVGCLESRQAFEELVRDLKVLGCCYSVRSCYVGKDDKGTFQYSVNASDVQIPFTGSPFRVEGTTYYLCSQGSRYYKCKYPIDEEIEEEEESTEVCKKKRRKTRETIKVGCPAKMTVKCIRVYPGYKASVKSWRRKCEVLKRLKMDLKQNPPPVDEVQYWISVSPQSVHNHKRTTTQKIQPLHPDLITEIHRLVKSGVTTVPEVKSQLLTFVENMFKNSSFQPEPSNTAFYPNDKSIYNHLHGAKNSILKHQNSQAIDSPKQNTKECSSTMDTSVGEESSCGEHLTEKSPGSHLKGVPILSNSMENEWQDQTVFSSNLVQVVNNNGMIMLMVAQPIGEQFNNVGNTLADSGSNILNVNLDDNIFEVSVDDPTDRILDLTDDTVMMSQTCDSQDDLTHPLCINDNASLLINDKVNEVDSSRIITLEGNVIVDVRHPNYEKDTDEGVLHCSGEQIPLLFSEDEQLQLVDQEQESRVAQQQLPNDSAGERSCLSRIDLYQQPQPCLLSMRDGLKNDLQRTVTLREEFEHQFLNNSSSSGNSEQNLSSIRETLRDCVQDIIKISQCCTNVDLLEKTVNVLEKYRTRLRCEVTDKHNTSSKRLSPLMRPSQNASVLKTNECVSNVNVLCSNECENRSPKSNNRTSIRKMNFASKDENNSLTTTKRSMPGYSLVISDS